MSATTIHASAVVESGAVLGEGCVIHAGAVITRHSVLGPGVVVHPYAVVGGDPQYLKFDPSTPSQVHIGAGTVVREYVTVNRSIHAGKATVVGQRCFLMASSHVGHDCEVAEDVVLANAALLAGHVSVGRFTFVGGGAGVHQFTRIGEGVMVGGNSRITLDLPPYLLVAERDEVAGLNLVGLRRRGVSREAIRELKEAYRSVYFRPGAPRALAEALRGTALHDEARRFLDFFSGGKRGVARPERRGGAGAEGDEA